VKLPWLGTTTERDVLVRTDIADESPTVDGSEPAYDLLTQAEAPAQSSQSSVEPLSPPKHQRRRLPLYVIGLICALFVVAVALRLNGSSTALHSDHAGHPQPSDLLYGPPRPIRSDEWVVRTPWVLRQDALDYAQYVDGAVGSHDAALVMDVPVVDWLMLFRPHQLGYPFLPVEYAFAFEWWSVALIQLFGVAWLLQTITRRPLLSLACGAMVSLSPVMQWWYVPWTFNSIGFGSIAAAALIRATRAERSRSRWAWAALAGWAATSFIAVLYPPWLISTAVLLACTVAGVVIADQLATKERLGVRLWRLGSVAGIVAVVVALGVTLLYVDHRDGVEAIADTVYPGGRASEESGRVPMNHLFDGSLDQFSSAPSLAEVNGANQSENAIGLFLLFPISLASVVLFNGARGPRVRSRLALVGVMVGAAVLVSWMVLPSPSGIGSLLLFDRVQSARMSQPLMLASALAIGCFVAVSAATGFRLRANVAIAVALAFAAAQFWAAGLYRVDGQPISLWAATVPILVVSVAGYLLTTGRGRIAIVLLLAFSAFQAQRIAPLQVGIPELLDGELRRTVDALSDDLPEDAGWVAFTDDPLLRSTLVASGVNVLSAMSPYPDADAWKALDPENDDVDKWNRYGYVNFELGSGSASPRFSLRAADAMVIETQPCYEGFRTLNVQMVVTEAPLDAPCLTPVADLSLGEKTYIFSRADWD
jgi:hypothetical protein